jgi:protein gp37
MGKTEIPWCDYSWNVTTGCRPVSAGCAKCYAHRMADRFWATQYPPNADGTPRKFTDVRCHPERLGEPLHWRKPARIFVDSMGDLFHEDVSDEFIERVFSTMNCSRGDHHTYLILTKRAERMCKFINKYRERAGWWYSVGGNIAFGQWPLPNVWAGVSVEDQPTADERIPLLLQTPAVKRFVSYEPALAAVDFSRYLSGGYPLSWGYESGISQIIQGCESGPGARTMYIEWVRSVKNQCHAANVAFFFKQCYENGKLVHMPLLDGVRYAEFPSHE